MTQVPDLVTPDDDGVERTQARGIVQIERRRQGESRDCRAELPQLDPVARPVAAGDGRRERRLKGARPFRMLDTCTAVVEDHRLATPCADLLDEATRLPVRAVIDAAVEREHTDGSRAQRVATSRHPDAGAAAATPSGG